MRSKIMSSGRHLSPGASPRSRDPARVELPDEPAEAPVASGGVRSGYRFSHRGGCSVAHRSLEGLMAKKDTDHPATPGWPDMSLPDSRSLGNGGKKAK